MCSQTLQPTIPTKEPSLIFLSVSYLYECSHKCMYRHHMHIWCPVRAEEGLRSEQVEQELQMVVKTPFVHWKLNTAPLQEQHMLLTNEPSQKKTFSIMYFKSNQEM